MAGHARLRICAGGRHRKRHRRDGHARSCRGARSGSRRGGRPAPARQGARRGLRRAGDDVRRRRGGTLRARHSTRRLRAPDRPGGRVHDDAADAVRICTRVGEDAGGAHRHERRFGLDREHQHSLCAHLRRSRSRRQRARDSVRNHGCRLRPRGHPRHPAPRRGARGNPPSRSGSRRSDLGRQTRPTGADARDAPRRSVRRDRVNRRALRRVRAGRSSSRWRLGGLPERVSPSAPRSSALRTPSWGRCTRRRSG